jgi:hypothetical protein
MNNQKGIASIVIILTILVLFLGGILVWLFFGIPEEEIETFPEEEIETPEEEEEVFNLEYFPELEVTREIEYVSNIVPVFAKFCDELESYDVAWPLKNSSNDVLEIRLISQVPQYSQPKIDQVQLNPGQTETLKQCITFDESKLKDITEKTKASLEIKAYVNGNLAYQKSVSIWIHAWDDMIWSLYEPMDTAPLIAAWVTPRNPSIMEVISKAKERSSDGKIEGCQLGIDEERMKEELQAIYDTLSFDYGLSYVSVTVSYAPGDAQRVSLPSKTLKYKFANCIDGSVLFASLAEALNFEPEIMVIPRHAFTCISCEYADTKYCIETTLFSSFDQAIQEGSEAWSQFFSGKSPWRPEENTYIVSIKEAREDGITPLE